jgi:signal transduction histidine kinase
MKKTNKELRKTLKTLKKTQAKLVESGKIAALGRLVTGVAHEINTPIGIGVTAASHLQNLAKKITEKFHDQTMKKSDLDKFLSTTETATSMILANLKQACELINSFKMIAVTQSEETKKRFNVEEFIREILMSLHPHLKRGKHEIVLECNDNLEIESYPVSFAHIMTNLIMNSLIHGYNKGDTGTITIQLTTKGNIFSLIYSDDGKGIKKKNQKKIFEPFYTTNRARAGSGLGLHIVYNIVMQTLKGSIQCISKEHQGTSFMIQFPLS